MSQGLTLCLAAFSAGLGLGAYCGGPLVMMRISCAKCSHDKRNEKSQRYKQPDENFLANFLAFAALLFGSRYLAPHSVQNVCPSAIAAPHFAQLLFLYASISAPQLGQKR